MQSYPEKGFQQYIYALRSKELPREMEKLGQVYHTVYSQVLNERIEPIVEKTPELKEMHTDGGYGSETNDKQFEELGISAIYC